MKLSLAISIIIFNLLALTSCATKPFTVVAPQHIPPVAALPAPKVVLVLGGGGSRAFAHLGVIQVLRNHHIPIDMMIGTNTGSVVAVLYANHNSIKEAQRKLLTAENAELLDVSALHTLTGTVSSSTTQNFINRNVAKHDLRDLHTRTVIVATDLKTGASIPLESGPIAPAVTAATALPPYFQPVRLYGRLLIDGSTTDPIPVDVALGYSPKIIIAVNLSPQLDLTMPTNIVSIYDRVYYISDRTFNALSAQKADVVIHPRVPATYEPNQQQRIALIQAGKIATRAALPKICALLQKNHIASDCSNANNTVTKSSATPKISKEILQIIKKVKNVKELP